MFDCLLRSVTIGCLSNFVVVCAHSSLTFAPLSAQVTAVLSPGDRLFIPLMWFHSVEAPSWSVTANRYFYLTRPPKHAQEHRKAHAENVWRQHLQWKKHYRWREHELREQQLLC